MKHRDAIDGCGLGNSRSLPRREDALDGTLERSVLRVDGLEVSVFSDSKFVDLALSLRLQFRRFELDVRLQCR